MPPKILKWIMLSFFIYGITSYSWGEPGGPIKGKRGRLDLPDLTEEQETQIENMRIELEGAVLPLKSELELESAKFKKLMITDYPDKAAIEDRIDRISSIQTRIRKLHIDNRLQVRSLLTVEQRIRFDRRVFESKGHRPRRQRRWPMRSPRRTRPGHYDPADLDSEEENSEFIE